MAVVIPFKRRPAASGFPASLVPWCLAENRGAAPVGARWVHEVKHDGFRSQAHRRGGETRIFSRNGHDWTERYRLIADLIGKARRGGDLVLDGEIVVLRKDGTCDFWALQEEV